MEKIEACERIDFPRLSDEGYSKENLAKMKEWGNILLINLNQYWDRLRNLHTVLLDMDSIEGTTELTERIKELLGELANAKLYDETVFYAAARAKTRSEYEKVCSNLENENAIDRWYGCEQELSDMEYDLAQIIYDSEHYYEHQDKTPEELDKMNITDLIEHFADVTLALNYWF